MTLAKRPLKTRRRSPKRKTRKPKAVMPMQPMTAMQPMQHMNLSLLSKGVFKTSGTYSSTTLGKTQNFDWDTTINTDRDGAKMTFDVNRNKSNVSGDLNATIKNHLASVKGTIKKDGKVHQVDMKDINMFDQMSMQHAGLEMAMMLR